jgi:hypothetical protein
MPGLVTGITFVAAWMAETSPAMTTWKHACLKN